MSSAAKKELHDLVDALPDSAVEEVREYLDSHRAGDPFADMDPEERAKLHAAIEQSEKEIAAGEGIPIEDVIAELHSAR